MLTAESILLCSLLLCAGINRKVRPCVCSLASVADFGFLCASTVCEMCYCSPWLQLLAACCWNRNWGTVHQSITCHSSLYWKLNPPFPFTHQLWDQSKYIFTHCCIFPKNLIYLCCPLMYLSGFTNCSFLLNYVTMEYHEVRLNSSQKF